MMEKNDNDKSPNNRLVNKQEFVPHEPYLNDIYRHMDTETSSYKVSSQKLATGEILLFILQIVALILLLLYVYKVPFDGVPKGGEAKGVTVSNKSS